jgi:hypothetical protein
VTKGWRANPGWTRRELLHAAALAVLAPCLARAQHQSQPGTNAESWRSLFDGKSLGSWEPTLFGGEGEVRVEDGRIVLAQGGDLTGITWKGDVPATVDYEIELKAMRVVGGDFFCGLTFPVQRSHCSLIVGGWGGSVVGLSSLDGLDASENETSTRRTFEQQRWYTIRVRVTERRIQAWIDDAVAVDTGIAGRRVHVRNELLDSRPLGVASWRTKAALSDIRWRLVPAAM